MSKRIHDCIYRTGHYSSSGMFGCFGGGMECGSIEEGHPFWCKIHHAKKIDLCKFAASSNCVDQSEVKP